MRYWEQFRLAWSIQWRSSGIAYVVYLFLSSLMWELQESAIEVRHLIDVAAKLIAAVGLTFVIMPFVVGSVVKKHFKGFRLQVVYDGPIPASDGGAIVSPTQTISDEGSPQNGPQAPGALG